MLTTIAAQSTPRASMLHAHPPSSRMLRPATASLLKSRHRQQTRAYRFGMWSSYFDPEFQRDIRRRHRMLKHKYAETLNRKLKWDHDSLPRDPHAIIRRVMGRYWHPAGASWSSRSINSDGTTSWFGKINSSESTSNGRVYTSSNPMFGNDFDTWKTELNGMVNTWTKRAHKGTKRAKSTFSAGAKRDQQESQAEADYVIDPITNRKVPKKTYGAVDNVSDDSTGTFKSYRSQFATFGPPGIDGKPEQQPIYSNGPPPPEELTKYNNVEAELEEPENLHQFPTIQSEEYSLNHLPPEEAAEVSEDTGKYNAAGYDRVQSAASSPVPKYEDLHKYKPSQYDHVESSVAEYPAQKYEDLHEYKPYRYNESTALDEEPTQGYDDLYKYRPYLDNDGAPIARSTPTYEDLDKYETFEHQEELKSGQATEKYEDLGKYDHSEFLDKTQAEESIPAYEDLNKYEQPYHYQEGKVTPDSQQKYDDLDSYHPKTFDEHVSAEEEKPFHQYGDLDTYKAFRFQEPDGKPVSEHDNVESSLKEFDSKTEPWENLEQSLLDHIAASNAADVEASANVHISRQRHRDLEDSKMTGNFVRDFPEDFSRSWTLSETGLQQENTDSLKSGYEQEMQSKVQNAERDYSEALSRTANASVLETSLDRQSKPRTESALNRTKRSMSRHSRKQANADPYSRQPQGLETSYAEECGSETAGSTYVQMYGTLDNAGKDRISEPVSAIPLEQLVEELPSSSTAAASALESTVYRILSYDPTTNSVSTVETTSVAPDQAKPITPAEALLSLSHPLKFLPHFAPLFAQGFEMVSGKGDILIFRKTKDVPPSSGETQVPINPIDMMGKPAPLPSAAAFASPTGFINYDVPAAEEREPPFRSNIDVRREEPVFSGPKITQEALKKQKKSVTKRVLIGGVWIAGLSYALGVIGEYFATGGIDGRGPTGF
ncbi:conserved serine-threonine rich protein [Seiridium cupressi]